MNENEFRIGRVLRQAVATSWSGIARLLALSALVQAPALIYIISGAAEHLPENAIAAGIEETLLVGFQVLAQAAVTAALFARLRGQQVSLGALLGTTFRPGPLLWFAIAYSVVSSLVELIQLGFDVWLAPASYVWIDLGYGALLYLFIALAIPVLVNERTGALESVKRSVFLTGNHRGRLLGTYVSVLLLAALAFSPVVLWASTVDTIEIYMERAMMWSLARKVIVPVIWGAVNASIYRSLRLIREGVDITSTPSVPDARIHTPD